MSLNQLVVLLTVIPQKERVGQREMLGLFKKTVIMK